MGLQMMFYPSAIPDMHCDKEIGVTRYVKLMLNSKFPVSNLMNSKDFLKYLSVRGFSVT